MIEQILNLGFWQIFWFALKFSAAWGLAVLVLTSPYWILSLWAELKNG